MATNDARGHLVPAATDHPARSTLLNLSLSIRDVTVTANTTTRAAFASAMSAAGQPASTSNPLIVYRTDSGNIELSVDGTNWSIVGDRTDLSWAPVWSATGTAPVLNNGSFVGAYSLDDKFVDFDMTLTIGSTTTIGSGTYTLTLPVAPVTGRKLFLGSFLHGGGIYQLFGHANGSTTLNVYQESSPVTAWGSTTPVAPVSTDTVHFHGRYRYA